MERIKFVLVASVVGIFDADGENGSTILGGLKPTIAQFPFIGSYHVFMGHEAERICTGVLIDEITAITAGHCVLMNETTPPKLLILGKYMPYLVMGVSDYMDDREYMYEKRFISELFIHPKAQYQLPWPVHSRFDIGAMKWNKKVVWNPHVRFAPLIPAGRNPLSVIQEISESRQFCQIPGWGTVDDDGRNPRSANSPTHLQTTRVDIIFKIHCCALYFLSEFRLCMQGLEDLSGYRCHILHGKTTSFGVGDGSPLVCEHESSMYVVGIHITSVANMDPSPNVSTMYNPGLWFINSALNQYIKIITVKRVLSCGHTTKPELISLLAMIWLIYWISARIYKT